MNAQPDKACTLTDQELSANATWVRQQIEAIAPYTSKELFALRRVYANEFERRRKLKATAKPWNQDFPQNDNSW
jgi:hypothetical protein